MKTKEMIEVMQAYAGGEKIQRVRRYDTPAAWEYDDNPDWNWSEWNFRIAPEPKKESRWERVEIIEKSDGHSLANYRNGWFRIPDLQNIPGYGGIDYQSPFDPGVIVRSMVPLMFDTESSRTRPAVSTKLTAPASPSQRGSGGREKRNEVLDMSKSRRRRLR